MAESDTGEKTLDASAQKLQQARINGEVAVSREGAMAGIYLAALLATVLIAVPVASRIGDLLLPLLDQPESFLDGTEQGLAASGRAAFMGIALALAPLFGLLIAGSLLPYILQNAVVVSANRISPKLSHLSPRAGFRRIFSQRALVEFTKSLTKLSAIGLACWVVAKPIYSNSIGLVGADFNILPQILSNSVVSILSVATGVAVVIAGIDIPYQHWFHKRQQRMSFQDMREEFRTNEGDPHIKNRQRKIRRQRLRNRMLLEVPAATVVVTNPTHFAVALRYERGRDAAPIVVAKGGDLIAQKIREIAFENRVAIVENPPLARALFSAVEIGEMIPQEYFETVAKIIGLVWARAGRNQPPNRETPAPN